MTKYCLQPVKQPFSDFDLWNLALKNLVLYPSSYTTEIEGDNAVLSWANVDFKTIGNSRERTWQFKGNGYTNGNTVKIIYTITTPEKIKFSPNITGLITSSSQEEALDANIARIQTLSNSFQTIATVIIKTTKPLGDFSFNLFKKDLPFDCSLKNNQYVVSNPSTIPVGNKTPIKSNQQFTFLALITGTGLCGGGNTESMNKYVVVYNQKGYIFLLQGSTSQNNWVYTGINANDYTPTNQIPCVTNVCTNVYAFVQAQSSPDSFYWKFLEINTNGNVRCTYSAPIITVSSVACSSPGNKRLYMAKCGKTNCANEIYQIFTC